MRYNFYGWHDSLNLHAINHEYGNIINTTCDLYEALTHVWCEYSCTSRLRAHWTPDNITLGQCSITAFLAQDIFGGKVFGIHRPEGSIHCYNVVDGIVFDLTSEQFGSESLDYTHNPEQSRESHFANQEKHERYEYLCSELAKLMKI